ncbi:MAG TPA: NUDIX domain-containing protein, partial [Candidatus Brocadiia bacterium]|nr:NUDIX domain-containing protein [Candidatus Brocadiia bacterium]
MQDQDELFSVVAEDGRFLRAERRGECHRRPDLIHASTSVMVFDKKGRLFLQKRADTKDVEPGKWDQSCSGHCAAGEDFEAAARREVMEELGFSVGDLRPFWLRLSGSAYETELCQTYTAQWDGPFRLNPAEISDGAFWTKEEFLAGLGQGLFTPHLQEEGRRYFLGSAWPKALAVDLDGTALDSRRTLAPQTVAALGAARRRGVRVFIATARPPRSAKAFIEELALNEPVIYYNGALVADPRTGETL